MNLTLEGARQVFVTSDFHFDHQNIIEYCNRPFSVASQMNHYMLYQYHRVVKPDSLVFFLGDMAYGRGSRSPRYWLTQLEGKKVYIKGSHDKGIRSTSQLDGVLSVHDYLIVGIGCELVYMVHDPFDIPYDWKGWAIHGHNHDTRPLIDFDRKRVNVSVEATNYRPINLARLMEYVGRHRR